LKCSYLLLPALSVDHARVFTRRLSFVSQSGLLFHIHIAYSHAASIPIYVRSIRRITIGRKIQGTGKPYALFVSVVWMLKICDLSYHNRVKTEARVHFSGFIRVLELPHDPDL
jgi:hypothetical protein